MWGDLLSAFIIGAGFPTATALVAGNGHISATALCLILLGGATTAAKDYRSLRKLPPINGNDLAGQIDKNQTTNHEREITTNK